MRGWSRLCEQIDFFQLFMYSACFIARRCAHSADLCVKKRCFCELCTVKLKKRRLRWLLFGYISTDGKKFRAFKPSILYYKHDVDEIKKLLQRSQFIFNEATKRDFSGMPHRALLVYYIYGS